jgi:hypothetical protein
MDTPLHDRARAIAARYAALPDVEAVALAGSLTAGAADAASDLDLYVYARREPDLDARRAAVSPGARRAEVGNRFFENGDEWVEPDGVGVDVMFRDPAWIEGQLERVLVRHEASVGYSTCFWFNVRTSEPLFDRTGWLAGLRRAAAAAYPEPLRVAIIAKNHPLLRANVSSFLRQIERAVIRGDAVSVTHRTAALLASYFDVLFALNRLPHPGEKRLVAFAESRCATRPARLREQIGALLASAGAASIETVAQADTLVEDLDALLGADGLLPEARR